MPRIRNMITVAPYAMQVVPSHAFKLSSVFSREHGDAIKWFRVMSVAAWGAPNAGGDLRILVDGGLRFCWPLAELCRRHQAMATSRVPDAVVEVCRQVASSIVDRVVEESDGEVGPFDLPYFADSLHLLGKLGCGAEATWGLELPRHILVNDTDELRLVVRDEAQCQVLLSGVIGVDIDAKWDQHGRLIRAPDEVAPESS